MSILDKKLFQIEIFAYYETPKNYSDRISANDSKFDMVKLVKEAALQEIEGKPLKTRNTPSVCRYASAFKTQRRSYKELQELGILDLFRENECIKIRVPIGVILQFTTFYLQTVEKTAGGDDLTITPGIDYDNLIKFISSEAIHKPENWDCYVYPTPEEATEEATVEA